VPNSFQGVGVANGRDLAWCLPPSEPQAHRLLGAWLPERVYAAEGMATPNTGGVVFHVAMLCTDDAFVVAFCVCRLFRP